MTGHRGKVHATLDVKASVEQVFAAMVDLPSQDRWMLGTRLFALEGEVDVPEVGSRIAALTGIAGIGVLDTMTVTVFDPPHRWETVHTGNAFKGIGIFSVEPGPLGARVTWAEEVDLPLGALGRFGWNFAKPLVRWGLSESLRRLARGVVEGSLPVTVAR
ncbi:uncharacterized protein YndB with AHSA1/START domain [Nakamurella sp. UYEF19]|uniref:SRPBCC family protein n=1 Tax=Nakamurella sp. UYEF19 TaxID=1756392 RepID=UPI0033917476